MTSVPSQAMNASETTAHVRGSSALLVGRALNIVIGMGLQVLLVRSLSQTEFGAFAYGLAVASTAFVIATLGTAKAVPRFLAIYEERGDRAHFAGTIIFEFRLVLGMSIALFVGLVAARNLIENRLTDDPLVFTLVAILLLTAPQEGVDKVLEGYAAVKGRTRAIFFRKYLLEPLLRLAAVIVLVALQASVILLAVAYVVAGAVGTLLYLQLLVRQMRADGRLHDFRRGHRQMPGREILKFSMPLLIHDLVFVGISTLGVVFIGAHASTAEVAEYRAVFPFARVNQIVGWTFAMLYMPLAGRLFSRGDHDGMRHAYWHSAAWLCVLTLPIYLMTGPFARPVVNTLFGPEYEGAGAVMLVLATGFYLNMSLGFNTLTLQTFGHLRFTVAVDVISVVVFLAASIVLVPSHGALGAAIATAASFVVLNIGCQIGMVRMGFAFFEQAYRSVYASIAGAIAACAVVEVVFEPSLVVAIVVSSVVSLVVVRVVRKKLDIAGTFPEIRRLPIIGRIV